MAHTHHRDIESPDAAQRRIAEHPDSFNGMMGWCRWRRCPQRIAYFQFSPEGSAGWGYMKLQLADVPDRENDIHGSQRSGGLTW